MQRCTRIWNWFPLITNSSGFVLVFFVLFPYPFALLRSGIFVCVPIYLIDNLIFWMTMYKLETGTIRTWLSYMFFNPAGLFLNFLMDVFGNLVFNNCGYACVASKHIYKKMDVIYFPMIRSTISSRAPIILIWETISSRGKKMRSLVCRFQIHSLSWMNWNVSFQLHSEIQTTISCKASLIPIRKTISSHEKKTRSLAWQFRIHSPS